MRRSLICGFVFAGVTAAYGQPADEPAQVANNAAIAAEFTVNFSSICLDTFPDDAATDAMLARKSARAMTPEQIGDNLHGDTGKGWFLKGSHADFAVLIRTAPVLSCTVRVTTKGLFTPGIGYTVLEGLFARQKGLKMQPATLTIREPSDHYATTITNVTLKPDGSRGEHVFHLMKDYFADRSDPKKLLTLDTQLVHQILPPDAVTPASPNTSNLAI